MNPFFRKLTLPPLLLLPPQGVQILQKQHGVGQGDGCDVTVDVQSRYAGEEDEKDEQKQLLQQAVSEGLCLFADADQQAGGGSCDIEQRRAEPCQPDHRAQIFLFIEKYTHLVGEEPEDQPGQAADGQGQQQSPFDQAGRAAGFAGGDHGGDPGNYDGAGGAYQDHGIIHQGKNHALVLAQQGQSFRGGAADGAEPGFDDDG